jgi:hypothetical protein
VIEKSYEKKGDQTRERKGNLQSGSQTGDQERVRYQERRSLQRKVSLTYMYGSPSKAEYSS